MRQVSATEKGQYRPEERSTRPTPRVTGQEIIAVPRPPTPSPCFTAEIGPNLQNTPRCAAPASATRD